MKDDGGSKLSTAGYAVVWIVGGALLLSFVLVAVGIPAALIYWLVR